MVEPGSCIQSFAKMPGQFCGSIAFSFLFLFLSSWWMGALLVHQSLDILPNIPMSPALYHCHCDWTSVLHNLTHCLEQRPSVLSMLRLASGTSRTPSTEFDPIHIRNLQSMSEFKLAPNIYSLESLFSIPSLYSLLHASKIPKHLCLSSGTIKLSLA